MLNKLLGVFGFVLNKTSEVQTAENELRKKKTESISLRAENKVYSHVLDSVIAQLSFPYSIRLNEKQLKEHVRKLVQEVKNKQIHDQYGNYAGTDLSKIEQRVNLFIDSIMAKCLHSRYNSFITDIYRTIQPDAPDLWEDKNLERMTAQVARLQHATQTKTKKPVARRRKRS